MVHNAVYLVYDAAVVLVYLVYDAFGFMYSFRPGAPTGMDSVRHCDSVPNAFSCILNDFFVD